MFWDKYVALCVQHGESPNSVARSLSIASGSVTKWKNGSMPRAGTLKKIADYFGVGVGELIGVDIREPKFDLQLFALPAEEIEKEPSSSLDPRLVALLDSMTEEELAEMERYAEFILNKKKNK